jgi:voltage-gated potassium channel
VALLIVIIISVLLVMLESVPGIRRNHHELLVSLEWVITGIFTLEYITRIIIVKKPWRYIFSFYGVIDFLAVIPSYLGLLVISYQSLMVIRVLRLLRVFRILKLDPLYSSRPNLGHEPSGTAGRKSVFLSIL